MSVRCHPPAGVADGATLCFRVVEGNRKDFEFVLQSRGRRILKLIAIVLGGPPVVIRIVSAVLILKIFRKSARLAFELFGVFQINVDAKGLGVADLTFAVDAGNKFQFGDQVFEQGLKESG